MSPRSRACAINSWLVGGGASMSSQVHDDVQSCCPEQPSSASHSSAPSRTPLPQSPLGPAHGHDNVTFCPTARLSSSSASLEPIEPDALRSPQIVDATAAGRHAGHERVTDCPTACRSRRSASPAPMIPEPSRSPQIRVVAACEEVVEAGLARRNAARATNARTPMCEMLRSPYQWPRMRGPV